MWKRSFDGYSNEADQGTFQNFEGVAKYIYAAKFVKYLWKAQFKANLM